ncbi:MAG: EFR1 family ferrodoxin [Ruminococcus sp.]|nr:EFR1 family ferrodoxin [Ruminococcus sp.]
MLFYFTGTGNSLLAAQRLASSDEKLISMADAVNNEKFSYNVHENENVGFVFPVYFYSVPDIVERFFRRLKLKNQGYVYAVITCGGGIGGSGGLLGEILGKHNITLNNVFELLMPDNAMLFYNIPAGNDVTERLVNAEKSISEIKNKIAGHEKKVIKGGTSAKIGRTAYRFFRSTKKFFVDNSCVGCGMCAKNCPDKAIEMKGGKPHWIKDVCTKCTACINRCPSKAIQYGKATIKRNRYVNPVLKNNSHGQSNKDF